MLTTEQLLQPRYRVMADYPKSIFKVGEIINGELIYCDPDGPKYLDFPHLFQRCHWSDNRLKGEFPEYVRYDDTSIADKVLSVRCNDAGFVVEIETEGEPGFYYRPDTYDFPATREEYEAGKSKT